MNKQFIMLSGIPRSGSSVLCSMLNQHPKIFASTTSPLIELIDPMIENWKNLSMRQIDPYPFPNMIAGLLDGAYSMHSKPIIIDKNRLWPQYIKLMTDVLGQKPKIICTVRNISEVISSYILLINKSKTRTYIDDDLIQLGLPINLKNRCKVILETYIMAPYTSLRIGYSSKDVDLYIIDYNDIINNSQIVIDEICEFIGIDSFNIDQNNLQSMDENDKFHGGLPGLHDVRPKLERVSKSPEQIIGKDLTKLYTDMKLEFWKKK